MQYLMLRGIIMEV